jgi:hypothetical protein
VYTEHRSAAPKIHRQSTSSAINDGLPHTEPITPTKVCVPRTGAASAVEADG